jgi:Bacteriophage Lambda NinG protein
MGPPENRTPQCAKQGPARRRRPTRRPRTRPCLLKGCGRRFRPRQARERYCSQECRQGARRWSCWKARQSYRATAAGKQKRNGQSRRYRERVKSRKQPVVPPADPAARVITKDFFRALLRPSRLLSGFHAPAAIAAPTILYTRLPAGHGTSLGARTALASGTAAALKDLNGTCQR